MLPILAVCLWLCTICSINAAHFNDLPTITQITEPFDHSEGPIWDERTNILYFVDIHTGRVFSYNYETTALNFITLDGEVVSPIPAENNNLMLVGLNRTIVAVEWDGTNKLGKQKVLTTVSAQFPGSRFNDGKADKEGRLWFGTMGPEDRSKPTELNVTSDEGVFYKITKDNLDNPSVEISPISVSTGLGWNAAGTKFYHTDAVTHQVAEYDFDNEKGTISNRRVALDLNNQTEIPGIPDGLTLDEDDNLWIAVLGSGSVIQVAPSSGKILQRIAIPARDVNSVIWGGTNLDVLFVTSTKIYLSDAEKHASPAAGSVFAVTNLKTKGKPLYHAKIVDSI